MPDTEDNIMRFSNKPVYICCGATDMRKSINGLTMMVSEKFELDPFCETLFVFCNKARNRIKILEWDGDGFWLYFKRLERGHFRWPAQEQENIMALDNKELSYIIEGAKLEKKLKRQEITPQQIA